MPYGKKVRGMEAMKMDHYESKMDCLGTSDLKYTEGQFSNPEKLKESSDKLAGYAKKHKAKH